MDILEEDYQKAVAVVRKCLSGSVSNLQRKLYWGYGRAASAIDRMQDEFIVSPMSASGRRDVYPEEIHELWKELQAAKAQAVPEGFVLVKKELPEQIAEKMAIDRIDKPRHENDPVWSEIAEQSYKDQVKSKKWEFWRDYKAMIEAQEPANE